MSNLRGSLIATRREIASDGRYIVGKINEYFSDPRNKFKFANAVADVGYGVAFVSIIALAAPLCDSQNWINGAETVSVGAKLAFGVGAVGAAACGIGNIVATGYKAEAENMSDSRMAYLRMVRAENQATAGYQGAKIESANRRIALPSIPCSQEGKKESGLKICFS